MNLLGISLIVLSMFLFSCSYALYKASLFYLSNVEIIFFQSLFSWLLILPFVLKKGVKHLATTKFPMIALRSLLGLITIYCLTKALETNPLAEVILLNNTSPLFIPFVLWLWLREKIVHKLWLSLSIGFLGVLVMLQPAFQETNTGLIFALLSGISGAILFVASRQIAHEPFLRIMFYYFLILYLVLAPFALTTFALPPLTVWIQMASASVAMIFGFICFTAAPRYDSAQHIAPFLYTSLLFSFLIGWIIWGETFSLMALLGMILVCIGGVSSILLREKK